MFASGRRGHLTWMNSTQGELCGYCEIVISKDRLLSFAKNLYANDALEGAATRVAKSESTGTRWARQ